MTAIPDNDLSKLRAHEANLERTIALEKETLRRVEVRRNKLVRQIIMDATNLSDCKKAIAELAM